MFIRPNLGDFEAIGEEVAEQPGSAGGLDW